MSLLSAPNRPSFLNRIGQLIRRKPRSSQIAKERLQIILAHERTGRDTGRPADYLADLQRELLATISKYVAVDLTYVKVKVEQRGNLEVLEVKIELPEDEAVQSHVVAQQAALCAQQSARLDHVTLTTGDENACASFYQKTLGMSIETFGSGRKALRLGSDCISLATVQEDASPVIATGDKAPHSLQLCFVSDTPLEKMVERLQKEGRPIIKGPVEQTGPNGTVRSIYFHDPDRNLVQICEPVTAAIGPQSPGSHAGDLPINGQPIKR